MTSQKEILSKLDTRETIVKWIAALRSGEYKQGKQRLKIEYRNGETHYCCLGILYEVCGIESEYIISDYSSDVPEFKVCKFGTEESFLSTTMTQKFKMTTGRHLEEKIPKTYFNACELVAINDSASDYAFNKISDIIEEKLLPKFK